MEVLNQSIGWTFQYFIQQETYPSIGPLYVGKYFNALRACLFGLWLAGCLGKAAV
jgi:hypothetical protein